MAKLIGGQELLTRVLLIMVKEVKRYIKNTVERELWARAAGRCQFDGHNKLLYKSSVTQERVNIAQQAHIYSFSEKGPKRMGAIR